MATKLFVWTLLSSTLPLTTIVIKKVHFCCLGCQPAVSSSFDDDDGWQCQKTGGSVTLLDTCSSFSWLANTTVCCSRIAIEERPKKEHTHNWTLHNECQGPGKLIGVHLALRFLLLRLLLQLLVESRPLLAGWPEIESSNFKFNQTTTHKANKCCWHAKETRMEEPKEFSPTIFSLRLSQALT